MSNLKKLGFIKGNSPLFPMEFDYIISRIFRTLDGFHLTEGTGEFLTSYTATKEEKPYKDFYFNFNPNPFMEFIAENPDSLKVEYNKEEDKINVTIHHVGLYLVWGFEITPELKEWSGGDILENLKRFILELFSIVSHVGESWVGVSCSIKTEFEYEEEIFKYSLKQIKDQFFAELKKTNRFLYNFLRGAVILGFEVHDSKLGGDRFMIGLSDDDFSDTVFLDDLGNKRIIIEILNNIFGEKKVRDIHFIPHLDAKSQKQMLEER